MRWSNFSRTIFLSNLKIILVYRYHLISVRARAIYYSIISKVTVTYIKRNAMVPGKPHGQAFGEPKSQIRIYI